MTSTPPSGVFESYIVWSMYERIAIYIVCVLVQDCRICIIYRMSVYMFEFSNKFTTHMIYTVNVYVNVCSNSIVFKHSYVRRI